MIRRVVLSKRAQADLATLDRAVALRIAGAISRFAATGAGSVQGLRVIHPPEFRLRAGDASRKSADTASDTVFASGALPRE